MSDAELLTRWFSTMDSDTPEKVLDFISDDFQLSIVFSGGAGGPLTDFSGDRAALIGYLEQRLKDVRRHAVLSGVRSGDEELVLGEVTRGSLWEASFVAAAKVNDEGRVSRLLIGRSPGARFS
jgi:hypothetical protein